MNCVDLDDCNTSANVGIGFRNFQNQAYLSISVLFTQCNWLARTCFHCSIV